MSAATYLATWASLPGPTGSRQRGHQAPDLPRQRTWQEGRWHRFFHPEVAVRLPTQRGPQHDRSGHGRPALT